MSEHQGAEQKEIWKDEYLKWICGYANAQGGTLIIWKDDNRDIAGVRNAKKLLYEDKIYVWNYGKWPENLPVDKIYEKHSSTPYNPKIADVFYKAREIE